MNVIDRYLIDVPASERTNLSCFILQEIAYAYPPIAPVLEELQYLRERVVEAEEEVSEAEEKVSDAESILRDEHDEKLRSIVYDLTAIREQIEAIEDTIYD